jgi:DNA repair protein RecO (recombination protein O)
VNRRLQLQPCFLLHRRPFRDSSQLIEVLSLEHGRLSAVARGLNRRRRGGALGTLLQPFRPLLLSFAGRGELATLSDAEAAGAAITLGGDRLFSAFYLNELLSRLLHRHEAHPALFSLYGQALESLAGTAPLEPTLRRFELALLSELGYAIDLTRDAGSDQALDPGASYRVDPDLGLRRESAGSGLPGAALLAIAAGDLDGASAPVAKRLTRELLAPHLGAEPLRARALFRPGNVAAKR